MTDKTSATSSAQSSTQEDDHLRETPVASATIHRGKFLTLKHDIVRLPDGKQAARDHRPPLPQRRGEIESTKQHAIGHGGRVLRFTDIRGETLAGLRNATHASHMH